jgi:hypothetical protein
LIHPPNTKGKETKVRYFLNRKAVYKEKGATPQQEKGAPFKAKQDT